MLEKLKRQLDGQTLKAGRVGRMIYGLSSERNNIESSKTELQDPSDVFGP